MAKPPGFGLALIGALLVSGFTQSGMPPVGAEVHQVQLSRLSDNGSDGGGADGSGDLPPWVSGSGARAKETNTSSGREFEEDGQVPLGGSSAGETQSLIEQLYASGSKFATRANDARESLSDWGKLVYDDIMAQVRKANQAGAAQSGGVVSSPEQAAPSAPAPEAEPSQASPDVQGSPDVPPAPASEPIETGTDYVPPASGNGRSSGAPGTAERDTADNGR